MLEAFIITLREGLEAALAVGIALAYLKRTGRSALQPYVYAGLVSGVLASVAGAFLFQRLPVNQDAFAGSVMLVAAVMVAITTIAMQRAARGLRAEIEQKIETAAVKPSALAGWALFTVSLLLVLREGVETVLFLSAVSLNTSALANFLAGLVGIAAAAFLGYLFMTSGLRAHMRRFFSVTAGLLGLMVVQLVVTGLHELSESGVLPSSRTEMHLIGPIVHNDALIFVAMIALAAALMLWPAPPQAPRSELSEPERRKLLKESRRAAGLRRTAAVLSLGLIAVVATGYVNAKVEETPPAAAAAGVDGGDALVPLQALADGKVHWFTVPLSGQPVRFLAAMTGGEVHAGLDACAICGPSGYREKGNQVICRNCGSEILVANLGTEGGCNPLPLVTRHERDRIRVPLASLASTQARFAGPKDIVGVDPVCGMRLTAALVGSTEVWNGKVYRLCRMPDCAQHFHADPARYADR